MLTLSRDQLRRLDKMATEQLGIPGVVLMENAGRAVAEEALKAAAATRERDPTRVPVAVVCGGGNNGGDGYVAARHLHNAGLRVTVFSAADPARLSGDAAVHRGIAEKIGLDCRLILDETQLHAAEPQLEAAQVFVDALLGTGFTGELRPHLAAIIRRCNALALADRKVVAVDVPSGLDCDTGVPANPTFRADVTVTFVAMKKGFLTMQAKPYLGRVVVASIGTPPELADKV
ncbi:MAG: NAD(P)H-hydrate epimerase [Planctomycetota bacterium]|nr:NAD(P)H-hydrate epimerase [Planctomycetota bacterium]